MHPDVVELWSYKLRTLLDQIIQVLNMKGLHHCIAKIEGLEIWVCDKNSVPIQIKSRKLLSVKKYLQKSNYINPKQDGDIFFLIFL